MLGEILTAQILGNATESYLEGTGAFLRLRGSGFIKWLELELMEGS